MKLEISDLILDASVVKLLITETSKNDNCYDKLENLVSKGVKLWVYSGEMQTIVDSLSTTYEESSSPEPTSTNSLSQLLEARIPKFSWLATLAQDLACLSGSDPIVNCLMNAAERLGKDAYVFTFYRNREDQGKRFLSIDNLKNIKTNKSIQFIDLHAQQDEIRSELEQRIHKVLHHGQYVMGSEVYDLEEKLSNITSSPHCISVSSGTDALLIAMMALDIGHGDEVITSPFTFFATAEMIQLLGARPVFVDIEIDTFNIDASKISAAITPRTKAILPVSLYGQCADMNEINEIGSTYGIPVIEDAAQSFGASYRNRHSCALTDIACTSFFPAKPLGAYGDGGACFAFDEEVAEKMREIRDHGQEKRYHHVRRGINGRLDTMQAAVLLSKLEIFDHEINSRQKVANQYTALLSDLVSDNLVIAPKIKSINKSSWAQYTIRVSDRNHVQTQLSKRGIPSAVHYPVPLYCQPALEISEGIYCKNSDMAAAEVLSLPMHPYLTKEDQIFIVNALAEILSDAQNQESRYANTKV